MFRIVFICTGNRCRSPMAEGFVRRAAAGLPLEVSSAGLLDLGDIGAPKELLDVLAPMNLDISSHRARPVAGVDLGGVDLVIGFEYGHIAAAVVDGNVPYERAFFFREIVRLLESIEPPDESEPKERARAAVAQAHALREQGEFVPNQDEPDPFGGPRKAYEDAANLSEDLSRRLIDALFGPVRRELIARNGS